MANLNLKPRKDKNSTDFQRKIVAARATLSSRYREYLASLDESDVHNWPKIIATAREAGLGKDQICRELSCAWSTVLRWEAGQTAPSSITRRAIKSALLHLLSERQREESERADTTAA
jgi:ribosome-binding protein aMBF1 (putative translation factor)